jgi:hypothetical protein
MASPKIDPEYLYPASEAADLMECTVDVVKKKCREGPPNGVKGIQRGTKKKWYIKGSEIIAYRKRFKLDA